MHHPLYTAALQADDDLTAILKAETGRDRWTLTAADYLNPVVRKALTAKLDADTAWLQAIRESRNQKPKADQKASA